jgi:predicted transposase/invertase (TIGR01784 family)
VIALTITDFVMFSELSNVISRFVLKEKDFLIDYPIYDIELIFVELPKFDKELIELETIVDKWLYFLNKARSLSDVPTKMATVPEIKKAFYIANQANLTLEELDDQEHSEIFFQDQRGAITKALNQGLQEGIQQGLQEGIQRGSQQQANALVLRLLSRRFGEISSDRLAQLNERSALDLENLAEALLDFNDILDLDRWLEK